MHEQRLARSQARGHEDVRPHGAHDLGQPAGLDQVDTGGQRQHLAGGHGDLLGIAATGQQGAHLVADRETRVDVGSERGDAAGALETGVRRRARRRGVVPLPLQDIGAVDGRGDDVDQHLARSGSDVVDVLPLQHVGPAGFGDHDRLHAHHPRDPRTPGMIMA